MSLGCSILRLRALHPVEAVAGEDEQRNRYYEQGGTQAMHPGMKLGAEYPCACGKDGAKQTRSYPAGKATKGAGRFPIDDGAFGSLFHTKNLRPAE
jgi:hypothetical protein